MNRTVLFLIAAAFLAAQAKAGDFEIKCPAPLSVTYRGVPMIIGDSAVPEFTAPPQVTPVAVPGWDTVLHVRRASDAAKTRIEIAASDDAFELTFARLVQPEAYGFVRYSFVVPHAFLDGCKAEVIGTGVKTPAKYVEKRQLTGPLGADGISYVKPILYLRVHHPEGAVDLDFNPRGFWAGEKTVTEHAADWTMRRTDEGYVFSTAFSRTIWGTLQEFKFVIRRAAERPVTAVHPRVANRWTTPYPNAVHLNIGEIAVDGFLNVPSEKARWRNPQQVRLQTDERFRASAPTRLEGACPIDPTQETVLDIDVGRDGYYLLNVLVGAPDRSIGPCAIGDGEKRSAQCLAVAKGAYDSWALVAHAREGRIALHITGDFRLAAIGIAPMMYENEDFLFKRTWYIKGVDWSNEVLE